MSNKKGLPVSPRTLVVTSFNRGGESPSHSPTVPVVGRIAELGSRSIAPARLLNASAIGQFLGLSGLLKSLLDQLRFRMRDSANTQRDGKGVDEERLNRHGWLEWIAGGSAPRLLQGHSTSGEIHCTDLVEKRRGSGESLVNNSDHRGDQHTWCFRGTKSQVRILSP